MPADPNDSQSNLDNPLEIVLCRTFAAPRELVWQAWTDPNHVGRWWGPAGFTTTTHAMDFRPGGSWRYTMHGPDGRDYDNRIDYLEIEAPSRLVYQLGGEVNGASVSFRTSVLFEQVEDLRTRVTMRTTFPSAESRDFVIHSCGAVEGGKQHLANLQDYLDRQSANDDPPFSIASVFHASREKVWQAWTEREQLLQWFGPKDSQMKHAALDLRVGGVFHYCLTYSNGMELWGRWAFRVIDRPDRIEFVSSFSNADGEVTSAPFPGLEDFPLETLTTVAMVDHAGIGRGTLVTVESRPLDADKAQRDFFLAFRPSLRQGWTGTMQQLAEFLGDSGAGTPVDNV